MTEYLTPAQVRALAAVLGEIHADLTAQCAQLEIEIHRLTVERDDALRCHDAAAREARALGGPPIEVVITMPGLRGLLEWVQSADTLEELEKRRLAAHRAYANALDGVDHDQFNARLRSGIAAVIQGSPN